jgi:hypothetical protein
MHFSGDFESCRKPLALFFLLTILRSATARAVAVAVSSIWRFERAFIWSSAEQQFCVQKYRKWLVSGRLLIRCRPVAPHQRAQQFVLQEHGVGNRVGIQLQVTDSRLSNNIFYGKGKPAENYVVEGTGHSGNAWGVNMWFGQGTSRTGLPGTLVINDPRYVAPDSGNLRLQAASPALNNGAVGAALTTWTSPFWATQYPSGAIPVNGTMDFDGQARVDGIIDLGADEFGTALQVQGQDGVSFRRFRPRHAAASWWPRPGSSRGRTGSPAATGTATASGSWLAPRFPRLRP